MMDLEDYVAQLHAETDAASEPSGIYKNIISHLPSIPSRAFARSAERKYHEI